jgi:hypothetical protein
MLINSAMNEGLAGMQQSQKKMLQAAQDIVRAGVPTDASLPNPTGRVTPQTNVGTAAPDLNASNTVGAATAGAKSGSSTGDLVEPLIEQKRQQLLFDASANVVKAANDTLGRLIDDLS